jgi:hypothetical protein
MALNFGTQLFKNQGLIINEDDVLSVSSPLLFPVSDKWNIYEIGAVANSADDPIYLRIPINLPQGATITSLIVWGNARAEAECTWSILKSYNTNTETGFAESILVSSDQKLNKWVSVGESEIIDNLNNSYLIQIKNEYGSLAEELWIWRAIIKYSIHIR